MQHEGICAIVEPRKHAAIELVLLNVRASIPSWPIYIFHGTHNKEWMEEKVKNINNVKLINLHTKNLKIRQYNILLTSISFYQHFNSEYVLIFQTDSVLFPHSGLKIQDFLGYSYVGAPWAWNVNQPGGNGGLSLRRVCDMINTCQKRPYSKIKGQNEDVYFSTKQELTFPPPKIAQRFSVESLYYPKPFGCHKPWDYLEMEQWMEMQTFAPYLKKLINLNKC